MSTTTNTTRALYEIAEEIRGDWKKVNYGAKPYLEAMGALLNIDDDYGLDPATDIVARFLCNAGTWRGEVARKVKKELKTMLETK